MTGRDLACRAFWSEHRLCELYALAHGQRIGDQFRPAQSWSVKQLILYTENLPHEIIDRLVRNEPRRSPAS